MKRDMELVRQILLKIENEPYGWCPPDITIEGYTKEQIGYHLLLMIEANLLDGEKVTTFSSKSPSGHATRITWHGHEFLDNCRDPKLWGEAKQVVEKVGSASIQVWTQILTQIVMSTLGLSSK